MEYLDHRVPVDVGKVYVKGNERTKTYFFESELKTVLNQKLPLEKLKSELNTITQRLESSGLFDSVNIDLIVHKVANNAPEFDADLHVSVREKGIPFLKVESYVKSRTAGGNTPGSEIGGEIQGCLRNPLGLGDVHRVSMARNSTGASRDFLLSSHVPHVLNSHNRNAHLDVTLKSSEEDNSYFLYFNQKIHSLIVDVSAVKVLDDQPTTNTGSRPPQPHKFQIEVSSREEVPVGFHAFADESKAPGASDSAALGWRRFFPSAWFTAQAGSQNPDSVGDIEAPATQSNTQNPKLFPSPALLPLCQTSTKVSGKYSYTFVDTRDSSILPSRGHYLHSCTELAVPPGSSTFIKQEVSAQAHGTLGPRIEALGLQPALTLSVAGSLGLLLPLHSFFHGSSQSTRTGPTNTTSRTNTNTNTEVDFAPLSDRFHLGGPNSLRGFNLFGVGPRLPQEIAPPKPTAPPASTLPPWPVQTDPVSPHGPSLGGISKCSLLGLAAVPLPVPALAKLGAKIFGFLNFGGIGETTGASFANAANPLFGQIRLSAGAGVVVPVANVARLELTYAVPLLKSSTDAVKPFQIGVGVTIN